MSSYNFFEPGDLDFDAELLAMLKTAPKAKVQSKQKQKPKPHQHLQIKNTQDLKVEEKKIVLPEIPASGVHLFHKTFECKHCGFKINFVSQKFLTYLDETRTPAVTHRKPFKDVTDEIKKLMDENLTEEFFTETAENCSNCFDF